ncbi:hypothetical protein F4818DRAFT_451211 [Hypoxylon cercidicola]|nr:hypothetical protein F4818DRAFT_451211 [Hypoxylon cercidicola]
MSDNMANWPGVPAASAATGQEHAATPYAQVPNQQQAQHQHQHQLPQRPATAVPGPAMRSGHDTNYPAPPGFPARPGFRAAPPGFSTPPGFTVPPGFAVPPTHHGHSAEASASPAGPHVGSSENTAANPPVYPTGSQGNAHDFVYLPMQSRQRQEMMLRGQQQHQQQQMASSSGQLQPPPQPQPQPWDPSAFQTQHQQGYGAQAWPAQAHAGGAQPPAPFQGGVRSPATQVLRGTKWRRRGRRTPGRPAPLSAEERREKQRVLDEQAKGFDSEDDDKFYPGP